MKVFAISNHALLLVNIGNALAVIPERQDACVPAYPLLTLSPL
jgi:hypothetical protein